MPHEIDEAGNIWEVDAQGNVIRLVQAAEQQAAQPPADPTFQYQAPQAQADLLRTQTQNQIDQATAPAEIARAQADAAKAQAEADKLRADMAKSGTKSETERANAITGYQSALALDGIIADLERLYEAGPGSTSGLAGAVDYLPTEANERFDKAANAARGIVGQALGFTGGQLNSAEEAKLNIGPYIPSSTDKDGSIEDAIQRLKTLREQAASRSIAILGGVPDEYGNITPVQQPQGGAIEQARNQLRPQEPQRFEAAGFGADTRNVPPPEAMQAENNALLQELLAKNNGRLPVDEYARRAAEIDRKYEDQIAEIIGQGVAPNLESYKEWARGYNEYREKGGTKLPGFQYYTVPLSSLEKRRNDLVSNPLGAGIVGAANAGSFGAVNALAGDEAAALSEAYPLSSLAGEVGGAITGTAALGSLGRNLASRAAPNLLGGGAKAQLGRNVATDAAYGGIYAANSGENVGMGVGLGAGGSLLGQAAGKVIGAGIGGLQRSAPAQALMDRGVSLTVGRQLGEGASRLEDKLESIPFVGERIRNRMGESFRDFNKAAFEEGAKPLSGFNPQSIGREGVQEFNQAVGDAYSSALGGRQIPIDEAQLVNDLAPSVSARNQLPDDIAARADKLIGNHLDPMQQAGMITGETFQRAARGLKKARGNAGQIAGEFDQPYRETVTGVLDAIEGQVARSGDADVLPKLASANDAYRNLNILENASLDRARVGTRTGEVEVFAPSQLVDAARMSEKKYPGSEALLKLGQQGQEVLPSTVPNSGTTDRAIVASGLGAVGLGASGVGMNEGGMTYDSTNVATAGGLAGALALLGTKGGQQALSKILLERPTTAQRVGRSISARSGLFGSGTRQYALQGQ